jgi:tetratricopeptide (TPR) repeat protein
MENIDNSELPGPSRINKSKNRVWMIVAAIAIICCIPLIVLIVKHQPAEQPEGEPAEQPVAVQAPAANIATLETLASQNPNYDNLVNLSMGYISLNAPGRAIPYLKKAIKLDSAKAVAYNNLGVANIMIKNLKKGIAACEKAVSIDPKSDLAKNNLKWGLDERNKVLTAIGRLESTPPDKKDVAYYTELGLDYLYIGNYEASLTAWRQGLVKDGKNNILINNIGTAQVMKGDYDKAIASFNKVLQNDPNNQLAKNNIAWAISEKSGN